LQEVLRTGPAKQRKPTGEEDRERKGVAEGRREGGGRGRRVGEKEPKRIKKEEEEERRKTGRLYPRVPRRQQCHRGFGANEAKK